MSRPALRNPHDDGAMLMDTQNVTLRDIGGAPVLPLPSVLDLGAAEMLLAMLREKLANDTELRIDASKVETMTFPCAQVLVSALRSHAEVSVEQPSEAFATAFHDLGLDWMPERARGIILADAAPSVVPEAPAAEPAQAGAQDAGQADSRGAGKRILTIDDSKTIRDMLLLTLTDAGFDVIQAVDGKDGVEVLGRERVDVVITDINMPNMDGYQVIRHLRSDPAHKNTPILVLTTESDSDKKNLAREAGATGWMVKPFDPERLVATVCKVSP
jgi:two-component system chemotaxis response regulator CheY